MDGYELKLKNELRAACDAGGLDKLIYSFSRYIIKHDKKEREELVKNTILSGNVYNLHTVYKILGSGKVGDGEKEFNNIIMEFQESNRGLPVALAMQSKSNNMIDRISFIITNSHKYPKIGNSELRKQAKEYIDSGKLNSYLFPPSDAVDGVHEINTSRTLQIGALAGGEIDKEHFIRISIARNKLRELLQDGDYYFLGHSIKDIGHIKSHYDYDADVSHHDRAKEWARALNIAGIKAEELKKRIELPESVERFMSRFDIMGVAKNPSDDRKPLAPAII